MARPLKNTEAFNHSNLERFFNHSKDNNLIHYDHHHFMDFYKITGCDRSKEAQDKPNWRGQMKRYFLFQVGLIKKHQDIDFNEIITNLPTAGPTAIVPTKKTGAKKVAKKKVKIEKESVNVLYECAELQLRKSQDYQNPDSNITQAMHYRNGVNTIHDMMHQKLLRAQSLLEANGDPNFESLEDTYKDLINYASFAVSYMRGKMEGQVSGRDMFNKSTASTNGSLSGIKGKAVK